jgi:hypothetical protein
MYVNGRRGRAFELDRQAARLRRALLLLREDQRELIVLARYRGMKYEAIADLLGVEGVLEVNSMNGGLGGRPHGQRRRHRVSHAGRRRSADGTPIGVPMSLAINPARTLAIDAARTFLTAEARRAKAVTVRAAFCMLLAAAMASPAAIRRSSPRTPAAAAFPGRRHRRWHLRTSPRTWWLPGSSATSGDPS